MAIRTTRSSVTFASPFLLKGFDRLHPAGTYDLETDEDVVEGNEHVAYIRVATLLYLRDGGTTRTVTVDPTDLQAALDRDGAR